MPHQEVERDLPTSIEADKEQDQIIPLNGQSDPHTVNQEGGSINEPGTSGTHQDLAGPVGNTGQGNQNFGQTVERVAKQVGKGTLNSARLVPVSSFPE